MAALYMGETASYPSLFPPPTTDSFEVYYKPSSDECKECNLNEGGGAKVYGSPRIIRNRGYCKCIIKLGGSSFPSIDTIPSLPCLLYG